jgi:hypothetical protein
MSSRGSIASVSSLIAETAAARLKLEAGRSAIAAWEHDHGSLSPEEVTESLERVQRLLGRTNRRSAARTSA